MPSLAFDTLKLAVDLRDKAHFSHVQAEGAAESIADAIEAHVATKEDLRAMKAELLLAITAAQVDIIRKMVAIVGVQTLAIIGTVLALAGR